MDSAPSAKSPSSTPFYASKLTDHEIRWRDRYSFFLERGYALRSRYRPDWKPSWIGKDIHPLDCEDSIRPFVSRLFMIIHRILIDIFEWQMPMLLDAQSTQGDQRVCIKRITKKSNEIGIGRYLSSQALQDVKNHCVPILASFVDPVTPDTHYIVMPLLRPFDDPDFGALGEVVDFITQTLEVRNLFMAVI